MSATGGDAGAEIERLATALRLAGDRLGRVSNLLTSSNQNHHAVRVWEWSQEATVAAADPRRTGDGMGGGE